MAKHGFGRTGQKDAVRRWNERQEKREAAKLRREEKRLEQEKAACVNDECRFYPEGGACLAAAGCGGYERKDEE